MRSSLQLLNYDGGGLSMKRIFARASCILALAVGVCSVASAAAPEILVLSNRADLVSGGDALVEIKVPSYFPNAAKAVKIDVDGRSVTDSFQVRADGRFYG